MLIIAIAVYIAAMVVRGASGGKWAIVLPVAVTAAGIAVAGVLRVASGLGYSSAQQALLVLLAFVPLASLVMLAMVNARATKALRAAGYRVGFFGASRRDRAASSSFQG